jgi:hypothetical protein|eukprot:SAG25_NODE_563_length_6908_cov_10.085035_9_plen_320_part_00
MALPDMMEGRGSAHAAGSARDSRSKSSRKPLTKQKSTDLGNPSGSPCDSERRSSGALAQMLSRGRTSERGGKGGERDDNEVWELFQQFDVDGSGSVDAEEISALCRRLGVEMSEEQLDAAMLSMDKDGSGEVDYNEFLAWWTSEKGIEVRRKLTRPDASQGPREGSGSVDSIASSIVERLREGVLTKVESSSRRGFHYLLRRIPVELTVSCSGLPVMGETGGNMSVFVVLRLWQKSKQWWLEHGRSETIRERSPRFCTSFIVDFVDHNDDYSNEFDQWAKVELYQRKSQMADLARHVKHGEMVFTLRSIDRIPVPPLTQ